MNGIEGSYDGKLHVVSFFYYDIQNVFVVLHIGN